MTSVLGGHVVLVTGASRGIGRAIAVAVAEAGADVVVNHRASPVKAERVADQVRERGRRALVVQADVAVPEDVQRLYAATIDTFGRVDSLVANAGITTAPSVLDISLEQFDRIMAVNVRGPFLCIRSVLPAMIEQGAGNIVVISSGAGLSGGSAADPSAVYAATKAAEIGLVRGLAKNVTRHGIRVNCVAPGPIDNNIYDEDRPLMTNDSALLGRRGHPHEVATAVVYVCSPAASFIVGQTICVNGGNYLH
ncbi:MAG: beta-ketoacyl-ACP reductase [Dehalococcoidia bacterium]|nr:beta-ketoacyl-ACP reductase [Dehalococcoidia bacterium]